jgi:glycosyltransferase involved in cell wall biosynthesis
MRRAQYDACESPAESPSEVVACADAGPALLHHRALYASFDRVPSPKGAATHIERFATTLFSAFGGGCLHVLGDDDLAPREREGDVEVFRFRARQGGFLERALGFGRSLGQLLDGIEGSLEVCHFRDPWSGIPILDRAHRYSTVYELNGLPSIELPSTYPDIPAVTLDKIRRAERYCWDNADVVVTPSHTIAGNAIRLGADPRRIRVIPNGAETLDRIPPKPADAPERYFIYFGALQPWQGAETLLRAFARLADIPSLQLVICCSSHERMAKPYVRLAERLSLSERVRWRYGLGRGELAGWVAHASASVAPLAECARNLEQGCAPLKIIESMALAVPVVASDLPAVREIVEPGREARLVHPDRPSELARALRIILEFPEQARRMAECGRERQRRDFTWAKSVGKLEELYRRLTAKSQREAATCNLRT